MTGAGNGAGWAFIDGAYIPVGEARLPVLDWGFLRGDATYDTVHVRHGRFFRLDLHLERFAASMARLRMRIPHDAEAIREILHGCVARAGLEDAYVQMIATRGIPPAGSRDPRLAENRFIAFALPFVWIATPEKQEEGLHLIVSGQRRIPAESVDPRVKNYHWLDLVAGLYEAFERGGETACVVGEAGEIVEGPGFNIFALVDDVLVTPSHGMLEGITRRTVLELARGRGLPVAERVLAADELRAAREVFLTSTAGGVMPVTRVDHAPVRDGRPGPLTRSLRDAYWALHDDPAYAEPVRR